VRSSLTGTAEAASAGFCQKPFTSEGVVARTDRSARYAEGDAIGPVPDEPEPSATKRRARVRRPITFEDALWRLVGSASTAEPGDAARKHEYLAEAYGHRSP
jgi:hypothetical protein